MMEIPFAQRRSARRPLWLAWVVPLLLLCLAAPGHAAPARNGLGDSRSSFAPAPGITIEKATAIARKHTGGRVLSATPRQRSNGTEYRIRLLVDGQRVITVTVDSQGRIRNRR